MINDCWGCKYSNQVPGDCHLECVKPDPKMIGMEHGIVNGWFYYPWNYDPIWMAVKCGNFEPIKAKVEVKEEEKGND